MKTVLELVETNMMDLAFSKIGFPNQENLLKSMEKLKNVESAEFDPIGVIAMVPGIIIILKNERWLKVDSINDNKGNFKEYELQFPKEFWPDFPKSKKMKTEKQLLQAISKVKEPKTQEPEPSTSKKLSLIKKLKGLFR